MFKKHILLLALSGAATFSHGQSTDPLKDKSAYRTPVSFTENKGQIVDNKGERHPEIKFTTTINGIQLYFKSDGVSYVFAKDNETKTVTDYFRTDLEFVSANTKTNITGEGKQESTKNFYLGQCADGITGVASYNSIVYHNIYPGIDLEYVVNENGLKYQFIVHPNADASAIQLRFVAADKVELDEEKGLTATNPLGEISDAWPTSYLQENHQEIKTAFVKTGDILSFSNGVYDKTQTLVIDPFVRVWGTYFGGLGEDTIKAMDYYPNTIYANAGIYVTGTTIGSPYLSTVGASSATNHGNNVDVFISRFNTNGGITWSTYYGGYGIDISTCIAANGSCVVVGGYTTSTSGLSTSGCHQASLSTTGPCDGFIAKFSTTGVRSWGTYYGGGGLGGNYHESGQDIIKGISMNAANVIAVCGTTGSATNITTPGSFQPLYFQYTSSVENRGFVSEFSSTGALSWGTYYAYIDFNDVTILSDGRVAAVGTCNAYLAITLNPSQPAMGGSWDGFIAVLQSGGASLHWATFFGGNDYDEATAIDEDNSGNIYVTGYTQSTSGIASAGAYQTTMNGLVDLFIVKFSWTGIKSWSTFFGGDGVDIPNSIAVTNLGQIFVAGYTNSTAPAFASPNAIKTVFYYASGERVDGFVSKFSTFGNLLHTTYYGGKISNPASLYQSEEITGVAVDQNGLVVIAGYSDTKNSGYPTDYVLGTSGTYQPTSPNPLGQYGTNGFIALLDDNEISITAATPLPICTTYPLTLTYSILHMAYSSYTLYAELSDLNGDFSNPIQLGSTSTSTTTGTMQAIIPIGTPAGSTYKVRIKMVSPWGVETFYGSAFATNITVKPTPVAPVMTNNTPVCAGQPVYFNTAVAPGCIYAWTGPNGFMLNWQNAIVSPTTAASAGTYSLTLTLNGCTSAPGTSYANVVALPNKTSLTADGSTKFCTGLGVTLSCPVAFMCSYQWLLNGQAIVGANGLSYYATQTGDYSVVVTNPYNCSTTTFATTVTTFNCARMAAPMTSENNALVIYPNPSEGIILLQIPQDGQNATSEIMVYNATGQLVYDEMKSNENEVQIDLHNFDDGIYLIRVKTGEVIVDKKIVLAK